MMHRVGLGMAGKYKLRQRFGGDVAYVRANKKIQMEHVNALKRLCHQISQDMRMDVFRAFI